MKTTTPNLGVTRRYFFRECGVGLGKMALASLLTAGTAKAASAAVSRNVLAPRPSHFPGKAKAVIHLFMAGAPSHLDLESRLPAIHKVRGVCEVHDLHIWTITSGMESLSAHAVLLPGHEHQAALEQLRVLLHDRFGIEHMTIQIDPPNQPECKSAF